MYYQYGETVIDTTTEIPMLRLDAPAPLPLLLKNHTSCGPWKMRTVI